MRGDWRVLGISVALLPFLLGSFAAMADEQATFPMREVSVLDQDQASELSQLVRGQAAQSQTGPYEPVKAYPELKSKRPYYGMVAFDRDYFDPDSGMNGEPRRTRI